MAGSILLLSFRRPEVLKETVLALKNSYKFEINEMVVVIQGNDPDVQSIINGIDWIQYRIVRTDYQPDISSREAINRNLFLGLKEVFANPKIDYVAVIEDDICVSTDFFKFINTVYEINSNDKFFRAINGFSGIPRQSTLASNYGKYRFGVGWGWALPKSTWLKLQKIWRGDENEHWDGLIESYMKTGFVVAPGMSRIRNIGFGEGATHTSSAADPAVRLIQKRIQDSFIESIDSIMSDLNYVYVPEELNWRKDCRIFNYPVDLRGRVSHSLYQSMHRLHRLARVIPSMSKPIQKLISVILVASHLLD